MDTLRQRLPLPHDRRPPQRAADLLDELTADAAHTDQEGSFPLRSLACLRQSGLLTAPLASEWGGEDLGAGAQAGELLATLAAIGRGSLVVGRLYEGHVNALQLIRRFGRPAQQRRAAADAAEGCLFGVWNTEPVDGTRLTRQPDHGGAGRWRLAGRKTFASGLGHVARAVVTAARDDTGGRGWQMVLLATDAQPPREDRRFWQPLGMRASASFGATFEDVTVHPDDLLGEPGDYYSEPAFSAGAIRFAAVQQGGVEAVFDQARRFLRATGRSDDPHQRLRMGEMAWRVETGRLWLDGAARHAGHGMAGEAVQAAPPMLEVSAEISDEKNADEAARKAADRAADNVADNVADSVAYARMVRSAIEDHALQVLALADRSVGARGLLRPEPFERLHRDLTHYLRQPAPDTALVEAGRHVFEDPRTASALWN